MKLYLSSYKLGAQTSFLKEWLINNNKSIALIPDALDVYPDGERKSNNINNDANLLRELGFEVSVIHLKKYFDNPKKLSQELASFNAFFVMGGNVFTLRQAMYLSGFDIYLKELASKQNYLYSGYSAGICVLAPTLNGIHLVDDPNINAYNIEPIYEGLNIIDFVPVPHYQSDHKESDQMNFVVEFLQNNNIKFKTLKDGDVILIDTLHNKM